MIGMFDLDWRTSLPLSKIEKITEAGAGKHGQPNYRIHMDGGGSEELSGHAYTRIASTPLQLIPATAGIEALAVGIDDGEHWVNRAPVIGWARCFDGSIRIVTPAGVDDGHMWKEGQGYVLMPDGSVHSVGEYLDVCRFDSLDAYVAYEVDQHRQRTEDRSLAEAQS
ncbi:hypothetical protein NF699_09720 [Sphingomonadaceae bacterium OTU29LAMAA1]|nr:hypothetical protein NF699_09720 [Sphingomonadaceae bacterium OTU29LAMAA1]